jgi:hypothetical protein
MTDKKIAWEKWVDFEEDEEEVFDEESEEGEELMQDMEMVPLGIRTPIGVYSPFDPMLPSRMFDCWICHTNFDITESDKAALDLVDGIEVLKIMSRYRFFIGIGKMFSLTDVRPLVETALNLKSTSVIEKIILEISSKKKWAVGMYKDGSHVVITSESDEDMEYDDKLAKLKDSGVANIVTSDEF